MKIVSLILIVACCCLCACNKSAPVSASNPQPKPSDAVQQKLREFAGPTATGCGRLNAGVPSDQAKATADCALKAHQEKRPFYVAYDMPGMAVGVSGNAEGKLFSVQSQGEDSAAALTSGACPSELRVAASGRVTCFAPGDMGSMGGGHTAIPPGMPNPHAFPKSK